MTNKVAQVYWTPRALYSLDAILDYKYEFDHERRFKLESKILNASESLVFAAQNQVDEINSKFRRIIVSDYKLLYVIRKDSIYIMNVICTKASNS